MTVNETKKPIELSLVGYWTVPHAEAFRTRGWPDPVDLVTVWEREEKRAVVSYLRGGKFFRSFSGESECRICGESVGAGELTDGCWAWPEGLAHYVENHDVGLPEDFVARSRQGQGARPEWVDSFQPEHWLEGGSESFVPFRVPEENPAWRLSDEEWLEWSAANTAARPADDAISIADARALCGRLSHPAWNAGVEERYGRWRVSLEAGLHSDLIYLQPCSASLLERRLLTLRVPDPEEILEFERANAIASEFDGEWGAVRIVAGHPQAWLIWNKWPDGDWPDDEKIEHILRTCTNTGWAAMHAGGGKSYVTQSLDEVAWRWLLENKREESEKRRSEAARPTESEDPEPSCEIDDRSARRRWWQFWN